MPLILAFHLNNGVPLLICDTPQIWREMARIAAQNAQARADMTLLQSEAPTALELPAPAPAHIEVPSP